MGAVALARREQPAVAPRRAPQRVGGGHREIGPRGLVQRARRAREPGDRERVPRRQDLVVQPGAHPARARREERGLGRGEPRLRLAFGHGEPLRPRRPAAPQRADSTRGLRNSARRRVRSAAPRPRSRAGVQQRAHLLARPDVELALLAVAVGVEARVERAIRRTHLAGHPADDAARHVREARFAGHPREVRVQRQQRPVVVEHLLEVRNRPLGIDAVAAEAAAELVVDAAVGHLRERDAHDVEGLGVAGARVRAQAELEVGRVGKLGRRTEAAVDGIEAALELGERASAADAGSARAPPGAGSRLASAVAQLRGLLRDRRRPARDRPRRCAAGDRETRAMP